MPVSNSCVCKPGGLQVTNFRVCQMGSDLIIVVFAVVVIGGMGSIMGAIVTGFGLGIVEGLTKVFWPEASNTVIFVIMAIVLLIRPAGLFGRRA